MTVIMINVNIIINDEALQHPRALRARGGEPCEERRQDEMTS